MMNYLLIAIAPVLALLTFVYFRDKYEKEPIGMILKGLVFGAIIILPVALIESLLMKVGSSLSVISKAAWDGFFVAGFTEELFKYLIVLLLFFRNRNFNERYDGIVYAVSVSLGFAGIENILYVFQHGMTTGLLRAFTAVPAHMIMGIVMGYYLGLARFIPLKRKQYLMLAFFMPVVIHGFYDFVLMSQHPVLLAIFIPLMGFYWWIALRDIKKHQQDSAFNPQSEKFAERSDNEQIPPSLATRHSVPPTLPDVDSRHYNTDEYN
jgi:protease PrsW